MFFYFLSTLMFVLIAIVIALVPGTHKTLSFTVTITYIVIILTIMILFKEISIEVAPSSISSIKNQDHKEVKRQTRKHTDRKKKKK